VRTVQNARISPGAIATVVLLAALLAVSVPGTGARQTASGHQNAAFAPAVTSPPQISLSSSSGSAEVSLTVTGSNFPAGSKANLTLVAPGCPSFNITGAPSPYNTGLSGIAVNASGGFTQSLFVPDVSVGPYEAVATDGAVDVSAPYDVIPPASVTFSAAPTSGRPGAPIVLNGSGFYLGDTLYLYLGNLSGFAFQELFRDNFSTGAFNTTWTVPSVTPGSYELIVVGATFGEGAATFTVPGAGPAPTLLLNPTEGPVGSSDSATGAGYADSSVISFTFDAGTTSFYSCSIGTLNATRVLTTNVTGDFDCSFFVPTAPAGPEVVEAVDASADSQSATFDVTVPTITLNPFSGPVGRTVHVTGTGFAVSDLSLTLFSTPGGAIGSPESCTAPLGTLTYCVFTVAAGVPATEPGATFTVTVGGPDGVGDRATSAPFTVSPPTITLNAYTGRVGTYVQIRGSGFDVSDGLLRITSTPVGAVAAPTACSAHSGAIAQGSCYFTVASGVPTTEPGASFTVTVVGPAGSGDRATSALFTVARPLITLNPTRGPDGKTVIVSGSGFYPRDTSLTITSSPAGASSSPEGCSAAGGSLTNCHFTVASGSPYTRAGESFVIIVTGGGGSGDSATSSPFIVSTPRITASPTSGTPGTNVTVSGTGFLPGASVQVTFVLAGSGCYSTVLASGAFACYFQVPLLSPGLVLVSAEDSHTNTATAPFTVTPLPTSLFPAYFLVVGSGGPPAPDRIGNFDGYLLSSWSLSLQPPSLSAGGASSSGRPSTLNVTLNGSGPAASIAQEISVRFLLRLYEFEEGTDALSPIVPTVVTDGILSFGGCEPASYSLSGGTGSVSTLRISFSCSTETSKTFVTTGPTPSSYPVDLLNITGVKGENRLGGITNVDGVKGSLVTAWTLTSRQFMVTIETNLANEYLMLAGAGTHLVNLWLYEFSGPTHESLRLHFTFVYTTHFTESGSSGDRPTESIDFAYEAVAIDYF